jgi:hypothetical protein
MKTLFEEKAPTFGQVWTEITTLANEPYYREHRGEFGVWAAFLLAAGAIVRWFPGRNGIGRTTRTPVPHGGRPRPA